MIGDYGKTTASDAKLADLVEQLVEHLSAGNESAISEALQQYPEYSERPRAMMPTLEALSALKSSSHPSADTPSSELGVLGDYRLLREIGRGGMGVVYEAEQLSLRRRVALKMLPLAGMLDDRLLTRFRNEAQAAAGLHHPHIVTIYGVGCDRGVHYYAMQFIDGRSLDCFISARKHDKNPRQQVTRKNFPIAPADAPDKELVDDTHPAGMHSTLRRTDNTPYYRQVAKLGIQAASALHYAHELGIIHRDIKPANLLLDKHNHLWVADFGLARIEGGDNLTMSGDMLGTLRYMSPEQAGRSGAVVDHRTDVYSLGATLYQCLALRPVFDGESREDILAQIADDDPLPLSKHDPAIPADLETIVLKALAKEPTERFATAGDLADDLQRYCDGRPIRARRPTLAQRCLKWSTRHSAMLLAASFGLAIAVIVAAIAAGLLWNERNKTLTALGLANASAAKAELQRQKSESNFRRALDQVGYMIAPLQSPDRLNDPAVREILKFQADEAIEFCRSFLLEENSDPQVQLQIAIAYMSIGGVLRLQQETERAERCMRDAVTIFSKLVEEFPDDGLYRIELAQAHFIVGLYLYDDGRQNEAQSAFQHALPQFRAAVRLQPDNPRALHLTAWFHIVCLDASFRDAAVALKYGQAAVNLAPTNGMYWNTLGIAHYRSGHYAQALEALEKSTALHDGGDSLDWFSLCMVHWRLGDREQSRQWYDKALQWKVQKNRTSDLELRMFRAEADALMKSEASPP